MMSRSKMPLTFSLTLWNRKDPDHFALRQYKKYKLAAGVVSLKRLLNQSILKSWSPK